MEYLDFSRCSPEEVTRLTSSRNENNDPEWNSYVLALFHGLRDRSQLEALGSAVSPHQALAVLEDCTPPESAQQLKLPPFLVGLSPSLFRQLLARASPAQLQVLKRESITEPVQHQLTLFIQEMGNRIRDYSAVIASLEGQIDRLDPNKFSVEDFHSFFYQLDHVSHHFVDAMDQTNQALALSWNTMRLDLIEKLNAIKDVYHKFQILVIGHSKNEQGPSKGLYLKLENRMFSVYGQNDEEPAMDALAKLSIWYVQDYWEIGLLPEIKNMAELDLDPAKHSEQERGDFRENLYLSAKRNLENNGLHSVRDLKEALIFSKQTLRDYLVNNSVNK